MCYDTIDLTRAMVVLCVAELGGTMTFEAKTLVPLPCDPDAAHAIFEDAASGGIIFLEAPTGYALTEGLALAFSDLDRRPLWLRLGPEDSDPATFLLSLVTAARRLHHDAGQARAGKHG